MTKKCVGCGITLQSNYPNKVGYIPLNTINENRYCMRCFKIMHYNANIKEKLLYNKEEILAIVNKKAEYVFFLIDYLNINYETISTFKKINASKMLLISKADIIPQSFKEEKIKKWLWGIYDFNDNIEFISSVNKKNINRLINICEKQNFKEIYILGFTNAGKSTLINNIIAKYKVSDQIITTSLNPNTTLDFLKIKINNYLSIIDTPGFKYQDNFINDDYSILKKANLNKTIRPVTYQCKNNISFIIEDKLIINFLSKENSITFYMSNNLKIIKKHQIQSNNEQMNSYDILDNSEIVIKGLGFINVKKACQIEIYTNNKNLIEIRSSFF